MRSCNDIAFLSTYWEETKRVGARIVNELPHIEEVEQEETSKNTLRFAKFSEMKNWHPAETLEIGRSKSLEALADKIENMIDRGRAKDVEIMLRSILTGKIKVWSNRSGYRAEDTKGKRIKRREKKFNYKIMQFHYTSEEKQCTGEEQDFCFGHFRWNHGKGYTLSVQELKHVKRYFNL